MRTHPIVEYYQALRDSAPCLSRAATLPKGTKLGLGKRRAPGNTIILSQPYRRRVSTDRLNREGSQLAASLESEPGPTPAGKTRYSSPVIQQYKGSCKNTTSFKSSIVQHLLVVGRAVLAPAADLVCRNKWILLIPDHTRHQAAPWSSLSSGSLLHGVPWHTFIPAAPIASFRLILAAPSNQPGFGETAISRNTYSITDRFAFSRENDVQVLHLLPKTLQSCIPWQRPNENLPTKQRAPPSQKWVGA